MLVEDVGEVEARRRHRRAGELLEDAGALSEALIAYSRAEDWTAVRGLLGDRGEQVSGESDLQLELLPPALVRNSPWLALASARRARAEGRWVAAIDAYARAEAGFGAATAAHTCRRERLALAAWLDPVAMPPADWTGVLRTGLVREPIAAARNGANADDAHRPFVRGLLLLAAGQVGQARSMLAEAREREDVDPAIAIAAALGGAVAGLLAGDERAVVELDESVDAAERAGLPWLARLGRVAERLGGSPTDDAERAAELFEIQGDMWGSALTALAVAWAPRATDGAAPSALADARVAAADQATASFRRLGAGVLEAVARGLAALGHAEAGAADARDLALGAEGFARAAGTAGPRLLAYAALAAADPARAQEYEALGTAVERDTGLTLPGAATGSASPAAPGGPERIRIRTFGGFGIEVDGRPISLEGVKPRARAVLRLLTVHGGVGVHREVIQAALWPDADGQTGARSLHVAISSLRGRLADAIGPDGVRLIVREGDAYRLAVDPSGIDMVRFERAVRAGAHRAAIDVYQGELLPQDGPAEWVVDRREHFRRAAVEAATSVADAAVREGDLDGAIRACRRGLEIDRFHDPLWRILIATRDRAGDAGAAGRDRREYESVLAGLGVGEVSANSA
jgi:DNA-binding SARP family transcriptional activator